MIEVINILFPIFALASIGVLSARFGGLTESSTKGLSFFIFNIAAPVTVTRVLASSELPEDFPWALVTSFYLPLFTLYFLILVLSRSIGRAADESIMAGFAAGYGNLVLVGLPVILLLFGDLGLVPFFIILPVHGAVLFAVTAFLLESVRPSPGGRARVARQALVNPFVIGVVVGLGLRSLDISIPDPIDYLALSLQHALTPCALFTLGVALANHNVKGHWKAALVLTGVKNLVFPAIVYLFGSMVFRLDPLSLAVVVITAAQPIGVLYFVFAERFRTSPSHGGGYRLRLYRTRDRDDSVVCTTRGAGSRLAVVRMVLGRDYRKKQKCNAKGCEWNGDLLGRRKIIIEGNGAKRNVTAGAAGVITKEQKIRKTIDEPCAINYGVAGGLVVA